MPITVNHSTPADGTFSATGATAWDANHTLTGVGTLAEQNANAVAITGGTINNTSIGATVPSTVNATTITGQTGVLRGTGQNFLLQSQNFSNASWTALLTTVSGTLFTAPDGTTTANKNIASTSGNALRQLYQIGKTFLAVPYTFSFYAKAAELSWVKLNAFDGANRATYFNLTTGTVGTVAAGDTASITSAGNGWYRCAVTRTPSATTNGGLSIEITSGDNIQTPTLTAGDGIYVWGAQTEFGSTLNTYVPTTSAIVYGTPTLSFSGVSTIGLESNGALYLQPAGTGALQAQATTSTTAGGNARGANAVDWQTSRNSAAQVASGIQSIISGGGNNTSNNAASTVAGGAGNTASNAYAAILGGISNTASGYGSIAVGGYANTAAGFWNFIGNGFTNSGTSGSAVTTQSGTMNATTAVTLSGSNANIRVGQLITGTSIQTFPHTYVAAISGTSLTLSQNASGSSTSTLSFFNPHGVVVGGGNNQATGSYSFIGGGGDAGTAANRNVASGDYGVVVGGQKNTASGVYSFVGGGAGNIAAGVGSAISGGGAFGASIALISPNTTTSGATSSYIGAGIGNRITEAYSFLGAGANNTVNSQFAGILSGGWGTTRAITGNNVIPACYEPIAGVLGVSQSSILILGRQTTDATPTALASNSSAAGTTNQVILPNNSAYLFKATVISNVTGGGNTSAWKLEGAIKRGANAASTTIVGLVTTTLLAQDAGAATWAIAATADTTNGGLRITFTGQASTTIRTVCKVETTEVTF